MRKNDKISHTGIIESVENGHVRVKIIQTSACSTCQAKAMCVSAEAKEKYIDVWNAIGTYTVGEEVKVCGSMSMGKNAVVLAFAVPLVLMVVWLVVALTVLMLHELAAIGGVIIILAIYYMLLAEFKEKLSHSFAFWIEKEKIVRTIQNNPPIHVKSEIATN